MAFAGEATRVPWYFFSLSDLLEDWKFLVKFAIPARRSAAGADRLRGGERAGGEAEREEACPVLLRRVPGEERAADSAGS